MLFGLIKSDDEKVQEEYKRRLYKMINELKHHTRKLQEDPTNLKSLDYLMLIRRLEKKGELLEAARENLKRELEYSVAVYFKMYDSSLFNKYINGEIEYLENEYIDLYEKFPFKLKEIKLTDEAHKNWTSRWSVPYEGY